MEDNVNIRAWEVNYDDSSDVSEALFIDISNEKIQFSKQNIIHTWLDTGLKSIDKFLIWTFSVSVAISYHDIRIRPRQLTLS